jgi:hypothetical protein
MLRIVYFFPTIIMCLSVCASAVWFAHGDWRRGSYWGAAAIITLVVTF